MPKVLPVGAVDFDGARQRPDQDYVDKSACTGRVLHGFKGPERRRTAQSARDTL